MFLFDLIFLKTFHLVLRIKKDVGDTKWSSFLFVSSYFACFVIILISLFGLFHENYMGDMFKKYTLEFWMFIFILSPLALSLRYYRLTSIPNIEKTYNSMNGSFRKIANVIVFLLMTSIPILTFVLFRLFVIGQVKWW